MFICYAYNKQVIVTILVQTLMSTNCIWRYTITKAHILIN